LMKKPGTPSTISLDCLDLKTYASLFSLCLDFPRDSLFFRVLAKCALGNDSLESYCNQYGMSPDQFQRYINSIPLDDMVLFSEKLFALSLRELRRNGWRTPRKGVLLAIDFHDEEYYGEKDGYVHNTIQQHQERHCSATVHRYISAAIVDRQFKHTLCVLPVSGLLVGQLLETVKKLVKVEAVLMDRGFYTVDVLEAVTSHAAHYIMPAKINQDVTLAYWLSVETEVWRWPHVVHRDRKQGVKTTLFLKETRLTEYNGFITNRKIKKDTYRELLERYDRRWNVENSFKEAEYYRVRTSSKNLSYRLLLQTIGLLLVNLQELLKHARFRVRVYEMKTILHLLLEEEIDKTPVRITKRLQVHV
jgi:Transposase DDE domain